MSEFPWSAYSRWQEPASEHEVCDCSNCHENGEHGEEFKELKHWANLGCGACYDQIVEFALADK